MLIGRIMKVKKWFVILPIIILMAKAHSADYLDTEVNGTLRDECKVIVTAIEELIKTGRSLAEQYQPQATDKNFSIMNNSARPSITNLSEIYDNLDC